MIQVQEVVHGVTLEECQAALQNHSWNVQKAVQSLKVSAQCFRLLMLQLETPKACCELQAGAHRSSIKLK